ncbi:hypothetical protein RN001_003299 [Aquatica leii]|uniref:Glutaredoxin domain-containing protein n=1 Tax=Aquatica leii TaxID=1421715 RepID=A0AAN7QP05_9COLE|nr:hypothetical protein RN001_003299 [Aquatica leii]
MNVLNRTRSIWIKSFQSVRFCTVKANNDIQELINQNKVVVFMKGVPEEPRCGFSNAVVQILRMHGVTYVAHDVLKDESLRQGIKEFSKWPTIPQVFINGEFAEVVIFYFKCINQEI